MGNDREVTRFHEVAVMFTKDQLPQAREFFTDAIKIFPPNVLTGTNIYVFSGSGHIILHLVFERVERDYADYLNKLLERCGGGRVWNFDMMSEPEQERVKNEFWRADMKFLGAFDTSSAFTAIDRAMKGIRPAEGIVGTARPAVVALTEKGFEDRKLRCPCRTETVFRWIGRYNPRFRLIWAAICPACGGLNIHGEKTKIWMLTDEEQKEIRKYLEERK